MMAPVLFFDVFFKKDLHLNAAENFHQLKEINLCNESNLLPLDKMNLGFAVDQAIQKP